MFSRIFRRIVFHILSVVFPRHFITIPVTNSILCFVSIVLSVVYEDQCNEIIKFLFILSREGKDVFIQVLQLR